MFWKDQSYNVQDLLGDTPLHLALKGGLFDTAEYLVGRRAKINIKNNEGRTASDIAFEQREELPNRLVQKLSYQIEIDKTNQTNCLVVAHKKFLSG